jgi:hypothetical protein
MAASRAVIERVFMGGALLRELFSIVFEALCRATCLDTLSIGE